MVSIPSSKVQLTMKNVETSKSQLLAGYIFALTSVAANALSASCTQALLGAIPDFQLSVGRSVLQSVAYITIGKLIGGDYNVKMQTIPGILAIGISYMIFNVGLYGATTYIPLVEAVGMMTISSLVFTLLFSKMLFEVDIKKRNVISALVCVFGIILVTQPHWLFKHKKIESASELINPMNASSQYVIGRSSDAFVGSSLAILGGVGTGLLYSVNGRVDLNPVVKASYGASLCLIGSVAFMFYMEEPVLDMDLNQAMLAFGHAAASVVSSFLFFQAGHYITGPALSLVFSFAVIAMLVAQYTIMHSIKPGNYNWIEVFGCLIMISGASIQPIVDMLMAKAEANKLP